jgi:hypothetical protein
VALTAPESAEQLEEDLATLDATEPLSDGEYRALVEHGLRVRRHAGQFP